MLLLKYGVKHDIATIIGGHHGKPIDELSCWDKRIKAYKNHYFQVNDENSEIYKKWEKAQYDIFNYALIKTGFNDVKNLPTIKYSGQVILSGLLIMADWIASNTDFFPLIDIFEDDVTDSKDRLNSGFDKWVKSELWESVSNIDFKKRFNFEPREFQKILSDTIEDTVNPGIFVVEAPMGIGKTEAALFSAEQLAYKLKKNGVFFGLPTQATSNGVFKRIKIWLENIELENQGKNSLRLVHGKAHLNKEFKSLSSNINIEDERGAIFVNE